MLPVPLIAAWPYLRRAAPYALVALASYGLCEYLHRQAVTPSTATAEVRLDDGTVQPARVPGGTLTMPAATLPAGSKRIAAVELKIQGGTPVRKIAAPVADPAGNAAPSAPVCWDVDDFTCPPVHVRLDVATRENQYVVAARSADGMLIEAIHIPFATIPRERRYSVTGTWAPTTGAATAAVMRKLPWLGIELGGGLAIADGLVDPLVAVRVPLPW